MLIFPGLGSFRLHCEPCSGVGSMCSGQFWAQKHDIIESTTSLAHCRYDMIVLAAGHRCPNQGNRPTRDVGSIFWISASMAPAHVVPHRVSQTISTAAIPSKKAQSWSLWAGSCEPEMCLQVSHQSCPRVVHRSQCRSVFCSISQGVDGPSTRGEGSESIGCTVELHEGTTTTL